MNKLSVLMPKTYDAMALSEYYKQFMLSGVDRSLSRIYTLFNFDVTSEAYCKLVNKLSDNSMLFIRRSVDPDCLAISALLEECFGWDSYLCDRTKDLGNSWVLTYKGGLLIAAVSLQLSPHEDHYILRNLAVRPEWRNKHIASALVSYVCSYEVPFEPIRIENCDNVLATMLGRLSFSEEKKDVCSVVGRCFANNSSKCEKCVNIMYRK